MKYLLDTHAFVWWSLNDLRLPQTVRRAIADGGHVAVSVATAWEIAIKVGLGKWPEASSVIDDFEGMLQRDGFELLPIAVPHVREAGFLRSPHRDPFDRVLAAQANCEGLMLVTADAKLKALAGSALW